MRSVFSKNGLLALKSLAATNCIYAFDFDGTLSRITGFPAEASIAPSTNRLISRLSALAPIAVVSGRSVKDLSSRLKFYPEHLIGNHGIETEEQDIGSLQFFETLCKGWLAALEDCKFPFGSELEDKGYSLAVHFRHSRNKTAAKREIESVLTQLVPSPRLVGGKSVVNVLPNRGPNKGKAVLGMLQTAGVTKLVYVGDDVTDEDVFSLADPNILTIRVGHKNSSSAQYYLKQQSDINRLIRTIIAFEQFELRDVLPAK